MFTLSLLSVNNRSLSQITLVDYVYETGKWHDEEEDRRYHKQAGVQDAVVRTQGWSSDRYNKKVNPFTGIRR